MWSWSSFFLMRTGSEVSHLIELYMEQKLRQICHSFYWFIFQTHKNSWSPWCRGQTNCFVGFLGKPQFRSIQKKFGDDTLVLMLIFTGQTLVKQDGFLEQFAHHMCFNSYKLSTKQFPGRSQASVAPDSKIQVYQTIILYKMFSINMFYMKQISVK